MDGSADTGDRSPTPPRTMRLPPPDESSIPLHKPQQVGMSNKCDFCSGPSPTVQYHTHPFGLTTSDQVFGDAPIYNIDGLDHVATEDLHPQHGIGAMMSPQWLACEACSQWIDARDLPGLLTHCLTQYQAAGLLDDACVNNEMTTAYHQLFRAFFHYLRFREPWPPSSET